MTLNFFKPFAHYLHPHKRKIFWGLLLLVGTQAVQSTMPMLLKWAIDTAKATYTPTQRGTAPMSPGGTKRNYLLSLCEPPVEGMDCLKHPRRP